MSTHLVAIKPTPLYNTPHFINIFGASTLPLDEQGLLRAIEMIAFPKTCFQLIREISPLILQVSTQDYPNGPVYIDKRFVQITEKPQEREKLLPPKEIVLSRLKSSLHLPYIWGGNWGKGIPELLDLYSPPNTLKEENPHRTLSGLDCSGLLYEATLGFTPRNTSELLTFGKEVPIETRSVQKILKVVQPLDILVWKGHVVILFNATTTIESLLNKGVLFQNLEERINALLPSTDFIIRRFF